MYDMTKYNVDNITSKTWEVKFIDGTLLHILPLSLKETYKIMNCIKAINPENYVLNLQDFALTIINNNREKISYTKEQISSLLNEELMMDLILNYTEWITNELDEKN